MAFLDGLASSHARFNPRYIKSASEFVAEQLTDVDVVPPKEAANPRQKS